jgi:hypothetical protein
MTMPATSTCPGRRQRTGLMVFDQALASLVGFALSLLCLKELPSQQFALFTLLYGWYLVAFCAIRALTGEVVNVRVEDRAGAARQATTASGAMAAVVAVFGAALGLLLSAEDVVIFAVVLPALIAQSATRWSAFAIYRPSLAVRSDAIFLAGFGGGALGLTASGRGLSLPALLLLWGGSAAVATGWMYLRAPSLRPALSSPLRWLRSTRRQGVPFLAETFSQSGLNAVSTGVIASVASFHQLALFKAAVLLFGPVALLFQVSSALLVGEFVREAGRSGPPARLVRRGGVALATAVAGWTLLIAMVPADVVRAVAGPTTEAARPLGPYLGVGMALLALLEARQAAIRAMQRAALAFWCRLAGAGCLHISLVAGAWAGGGLGAVRAGVLGAALALAVSSAGLRASRRARLAPGWR